MSLDNFVCPFQGVLFPRHRNWTVASVQNGARVLSPTRLAIFYFWDCLPAGRRGTQHVVKKSVSISVSHFRYSSQQATSIPLVISEVISVMGRSRSSVLLFLELSYETSWCNVKNCFAVRRYLDSNLGRNIWFSVFLFFLSTSYLRANIMAVP
jgi:hypothetical protein